MECQQFAANTRPLGLQLFHKQLISHTTRYNYNKCKRWTLNLEHGNNTGALFVLQLTPHPVEKRKKIDSLLARFGQFPTVG